MKSLAVLKPLKHERKFSVFLPPLSELRSPSSDAVQLQRQRGAILACALPWLRCLLLQHAIGIMCQESSLVALNSLYQLIESRFSTFQSTRQLSSVLSVLYAEIVESDVDKSDVIVPVIFEDKDESDEEESEDAMETDKNSKGDSEAPDEVWWSQ